MTNAKCPSYNESWVQFHYCRLKAYSRNKTSLNLNLTILEPANNIHVRIKLMKRANGYKPFLVDFYLDACAFMRKRNHPVFRIVWNLIKNVSTVNHTCPYVMNHRRHAVLLAAPIQLNEQPAQETLMAPTQINELVSVGVPVGSNIMKNPPMVMANNKSGSEQIEADARGMVGIMGRAKPINPWTVTYGDVWRDTRLAAQWMSRVPRIHLASSPVVDYYPDDKKLVSVCYPHKTRSSIALYHIYGITMVPWFKRHIYKKSFRYRKLTPLRDADHQKLEYEDCHNKSTLKTTVLEHLECTSTAFAKMTRSLGYYPRHQNFWFYPSVE
ncbi:Hypothetical predicted protein [Drosophila guanche]|uniref:Uncharacterized protein n=1 Tax=Drosophila guanche TaxID=7266 RepID=A0A3B0JL41_DROGU|nr:Hypothetical predicted protein [Drosophila guanche]